MGTATAPLVGRGRVRRLRDTAWWLFGPVIGGAHGSAERRASWWAAITIPVANFCGAIDVFLFLWFVLPLPQVDHKSHVEMVNTVAFAITLAVTFMICGTKSKALFRPVADWLDSGEPADEAMVDQVLRLPLRESVLSIWAWLGSALFFAVLDSFWSVDLGLLIGVAIALGGVTTTVSMYLLYEKALHPITVRALSSSVPRQPAVPGVDARVLGAYAATTAGPLLGVATLGIIVLSGTAIDTQRLALTMVVLVLGTMMFGLAAMKLVARSVALPLRSVRRAIAEVEAGDYDAEVRVDDGSEVGVLQAGFNSMVGGLREREQLRDLFGRHVGENVATSALERGVELGGELRQAAVLFVDVIGSTSLAAERAPDDVVALLNRFFSLVVEVTREHGGMVNKFEGDGALCVFGAPDDLDDPAGCALAAARELDVKLRAALPELPAGIGVSAGTVVAGNVGAAERFEYTVIGDPVNEASRLVGVAKSTEGRVVASAATLARAREYEREHWSPDGEAMLRGRLRPTKLVIPA